MKQLPQFLAGQTSFVDGIGLLGTATTITLPKVEQMRETIQQGGFERSLGTGVFKAMEAEINYSEYHPAIFDAMNKNSATITNKGSIVQNGQKIGVVATFKGQVDIDDGSWETGKKVERKLKIYCDYYSLEIDGKLQVELDVENMIAYIEGTDHLETLRKHLL